MSKPSLDTAPDNRTADAEPQRDGSRADEVLALDLPPPEDTASNQSDQHTYDPKTEKAIAILGEVFARRKQSDQEEDRRRLADEAFVIREAATRLTGTSLISSTDDKRLLIAHHLKEFFAALPLPPETDPDTKASLRREALTMLLKLRPQDDIERMLLMQMIASHMASMTCFSRMAAPGASPPLAAQALGQAQKMSRLFLDIERAFRQRRKALGDPKSPESNEVDPRLFAETTLWLLKKQGITLDDDDASP